MKGSTLERVEFRILISHGAAMIFDRLIPVASIPGPGFLRLSARSRVALTLLLLGLCVLGGPMRAQGISLLRDPDIEHGLRELATPVLRAAGLDPSHTRLLVVDSASLNAFVIDHTAIFLNYGLILRTSKPEMLQAVIAHEAAHIANGHIGRRGQNMRSAGTAAGLGTALAVLAGALAGGEAAVGIAAGTQTSALRSFLSHTRAEEASADRSALTYLRRAGINPRGMVELHGLFAGQEVLSRRNQDPYMRSHPLTRDRIRAAEAVVATLPKAALGVDPEAAYWLARVQGKLSAFKRAPKWTRRRLRSETYADVKLMRGAIADFRSNKLDAALRQMRELRSLRPNDPYYAELEGQILYENRRWAEANAAYYRAAKRAPKDALILAGLGRTQLSAGKPKTALATLERARLRDFRNHRLLRDMSLAYAQTGQPGMASVVTAERYALRGRLTDAGQHAKRALGLLPEGSPPWRRAQDVFLAYERSEKRKKK
jgi:predicted Zn-dependent protease